MATAKLSPLFSHVQFPSTNDARQDCSLYVALIQQSVRKWEKPWQHQRAIVLFATSAEETKMRLQLEERIRPGEHVLQIVKVGEQ